MNMLRDIISWEERIISEEKGKRVVQYLVMDSCGNSVLAVEGTERSLRHMTYVVSQSFLDQQLEEDEDETHSFTFTSTNTPLKWRSRREVIQWLTTLVSTTNNHHHHHHHHSRFHSHSPVMLHRKFKAQIADIVWNGTGWCCSKQLMHYSSFTRTGFTFSVHSFVFIMAAEGNSYLAYLEDMYEDKKSQKKVRVRWFHRHEEVVSLVSHIDAHPSEVFITSHVQVINAQCISGPASVLTPKHYDQCVAVLPQSILCRVHLCFRQFKNDQIRPFTVTKLLGYRKQPVLSCIDHLLSSENNTKKLKFSEDRHDKSRIRDDSRQGCKRKGYNEGRNGDIKPRVRKRPNLNQKIYTAETSPSTFRTCHTTEAVSSYPKLTIKLAGRIFKHGISASFNINDEIELLSQDSGIRGCWFKCKVLEISKKHLKVQYDDLEDAENSGNLQEWVASCRVAAPDRLGMRCSGRLTTRPCPPMDPGYCILELGTAVDVWWCNGWWEGAVITTSVCGSDHVQIYLPGEDRYLTVEKSLVRTAKDWVNGHWIHAKARPDILSYISTNSNSCMFDCSMPPISEIVEAEEVSKDVAVVARHDPVCVSIDDHKTGGRHLIEQEIFDDELLVENIVGCEWEAFSNWQMNSVEAPVRQ